MYTKYSVNRYKRKKKRKKKKEKEQEYDICNKKTCSLKIPEKQVRWHVDGWRHLTLLLKKGKILISLPHAEIALALFPFGSLRLHIALYLPLTHNVVALLLAILPT